MPRFSSISIVAALILGAAIFQPRATQAAPTQPKRLLIVTTSIGFRHAAVPMIERAIRDMAKETGEFTVVSTSDSPDFPAAAYKSQVDQRNARIPQSEARPNDLPPIDGQFGGPGASPAQYAAVEQLNASTDPLAQATVAATASLNAAIYSGHASAADLKPKAEAQAVAELALANALQEAIQHLQSSSARLNDDQLRSLARARAASSGAASSSSASQAPPLSPSQRSALIAMNTSLAPLAKSLAAARSTLFTAAYAPGTTSTDLKKKADALADAELAMANASAAAFARIQSSPDKLSPAQAQMVASAGFAPERNGNGPDPIASAVAKVLQQYMSPEALKNYDAVAFASTTGDLPIPDKEAFLRWIADGHGFIGFHSATDTLRQTPEYIKMIGAEFAGHGRFHPAAVVKNMDPASPINAGWGESRTLNEEFYLFKNYDPAQVHLLLAMPVQPYTKQPGTYPVSWIKMYGKGRVYYSSLGHRDDVIMPDATIGDQQFKVRFNQAPTALAVQRQMLQGIRWALGLIGADATPQQQERR